MIGLTRQEYRDLTLSVGTHRGDRRLSPLEVARLLDKALGAGTSRRECAAALGVGTSQIGTFLKLLVLASDIQHFADWRGTKSASIPFSTLAELARLSPQDQVPAARSVLRHNLTWKEVVQLAQIADRSGKGIEECIADVLKLRPQIETHYLFVGAIISDSLRHDLGTLSQRDRDRLIAQTFFRLTGPDYGVRGRLGAEEFTVLSQHDLPRLLNVEPDELEEIVNDALETLRIPT